MTPEQYCADKAAPVGSSLYYSLVFLAPERRRAITALHAFGREIGSIVADADAEGADPALARTRLAWWQTELERLRAGQPQHPVTRALSPHVERFGLPREGLAQVIDGAMLDLSQTRYLDFVALRRASEALAGAVAELAARICGDASDATVRYARELGLALRLVDIVGDAGEDARRGRIYLPIEDLQRFGVKAADILAARYVPGFEPLMRFQAERARAIHRGALAVLPATERRAQRPGLILGALQQALLAELEREGFRVLHQRIALTPLRKLLVAWRTWVFGARSAAEAAR